MMSDKIIWHKTKRRKNLVVSVDADLSQWPDYEEEQGEHHLGHTQEELEEMDRNCRKLRDAELARTDYMVLPDQNPTQELLDYRQSLRDAPAHEGWPLKTPNIDRINT